MTNYTLDNTDKGDIDRTILWQYDNATHLVALITAFKDFFNEAVTKFWDGFADSVNLADENKVDDYGLAVWGKILNFPRVIPTATEPITISAALYRKVLVARMNLVRSNASLQSYCDYINAIFGDKVSLIDDGTMSLELSFGDNLTEEEAALANSPDILLIYPAGVKSAAHSPSLMLGLSDDSDNPQDSDCGGLDESSFNWLGIQEGDSSD